MYFINNSIFLQYVSNKEKSKYMGLKLIEIKNNKKRHQVS